MMRALALLALAGFILLPLVQAVILSVTATLPGGEPTIGLMNYRAVWADPALRAAMVNSGFYVVLNVGFCIALALPAAYALARFRFLGDRHFLLVILVFRVTPPVVLSLPIFILFSQFGLVNSPVGIALVHCLFNLPVAIGDWKASSGRCRAPWTKPHFWTAIPARPFSFATCSRQLRPGSGWRLTLPGRGVVCRQRSR